MEEIFDTGCSQCMSGNKERTSNKKDPEGKIKVTGFNDGASHVEAVGMNKDGKRELFVPDMSPQKVLLSAAQYTTDGCALLFKDKGYVIALDETKLNNLKDWAKMNKVQQELKVINNVYYVDRDKSSGEVLNEQEEANQVATKYFNTKVNVANGDERILTLMLSGFNYQDLLKVTENKLITGLPPDLTKHQLYRFANRYGTTPDIVRLALPVNRPNLHGLKDIPEPIIRVGQQVEMDVFDFDYNVVTPENEDTQPNANNKPKKARKLETWGGAIAAAVCVDCHSGLLMGKLIKNFRNTKEWVQYFMDEYGRYGYNIEELATDSGVIKQTVYQVNDTELEKLCKDNYIKLNISEPHNHSRGTPTVESSIHLIKGLMRMAFMYIFRNPNFNTFGFTKVQIQKFWGEIFHWSLMVINFKISPKNTSITRYECFMGKKPNMQNICLLPIFSSILVYRQPKTLGNEIYTNQPYHQTALYLGPSKNTPGAIKAAVITNGKITVLVTSKFTAASDGGSLNVYPLVESGLRQTIEERKLNSDSSQDNMESMQIDSEVSYILDHGSDNEVPFAVKDVEELTTYETHKYPDLVMYDDINANNNEQYNNTLDDIIISEEEELNLPTTSSSSNDEESFKHAAQTTMNEPPPRKTYKKQKKQLKQQPNKIQTRSQVKANEKKTPKTKKKKVHTAMFADWTEAKSDNYFFSFENLRYISIAEHVANVAITGKDLPKTFKDALSHPQWGEASRLEWDKIVDSQCLVVANSDKAKEDIQNGAVVVHLFPVYERKVKEGVTVNKVRLVADGRAQKNPGNVYASTPTREELLVMIQYAASMGWSIVHIDEMRAFLTAEYQGDQKAYAKLRGDPKFYDIIGALYGLRTSPRDYQLKTRHELVTTLGYRRLSMVGNVFVKTTEHAIIFIYTYVDDFIIMGSEISAVEEAITAIRKIITTTPPIWDPTNLLGMQITWYRDKQIVCITMVDKITTVYNKFQHLISNYGNNRNKKTPMPVNGYIVGELDKLPEQKQQKLNKQELDTYMALVGSFIWITGVRFDSLLATVYLSWQTKDARQHHLEMAVYLMQYLYNSKDMPLVLGGKAEMHLTGYVDASLGTGPKGRSIIGEIYKLNPDAGAICAKSSTSLAVDLSSFEAELEGVCKGFKSISRIDNIITEMNILMESNITLWSDNLAMIDFVKGQNMIKGARHMSLRLFYVREKYTISRVKLGFLEGANMPADKLTKLACEEQHNHFCKQVMGLKLMNNE